MKYVISEAAKAADASLEPMDITEAFSSEKNVPREQNTNKPKDSILVINKRSNGIPSNSKNVRLVSRNRPR